MSDSLMATMFDIVLPDAGISATVVQPTAASLNATVVQDDETKLLATVTILGRKLTAAPTQVAISGTTARNASELTAGRYFLKTTIDCFVKQGSSTVEAAATDYIIFAGEEAGPFVVSAASTGYFAAITGGGSGTLHIKSAEEV
jgi:hypothetical protein